MARFRLKDGHPALKVLDEIFAKLDELGVRFDFPNSSTMPTVTVGDLGTFELVDVDNNEGMFSVPPQLDFKLCYDRVTEEEERRSAER
jgi:hypothetical protein